MKQSRLFSYLFCLLALSFVNSLSAQKAISVESFSEIVLTGRLNVELKIADKEEVIIETKGIEAFAIFRDIVTKLPVKWAYLV